MRRVICLLLILTTTVAIVDAQDQAQNSEVVDLILVAGQSNSVGYDAKPSQLPPDANDREVMFWWRCGDPPPDEHDSLGRQWGHLQPQPIGHPKQPKQGRQYGNFAQKEGGFGPEIGLGRTLSKQQSCKLAIVKAAFSGTGMKTDWNPKDPGDAGACYRALVDETKAATAAAKARGLTLRPRALVWVQGESDSNATDAPNYERNLGEMLDALRRDIEAPQLVALLALNTQFGGGKNTFVPQVIDAQKALAAKDAKRCVYVDTAGVTIANGAHWDTAGTIEVGRRFADALLKLEGGK